MGKRSNFERVERDFYPTPDKAFDPLMPHLFDIQKFVEPCAGDGALIRSLEARGLECSYACDVAPRMNCEARDALSLTREDIAEDAVIITNPPWDRRLLHPMILHFAQLAPTWLLFDADWAHTKQSAPYMALCTHIVSVGRLKWIPDSKMTGKDNCAWYRFQVANDNATRFIGRKA